MSPLEIQTFVNPSEVQKGLSSLSSRKRGKENLNLQHELENKKVKICSSGLTLLGQQHLIEVQLSKCQRITKSENSDESSSNLTNSSPQFKKKVKSKKHIWDTKRKKKKALNVEGLFEKMINDKGAEIDKALKGALQKVGPISTDVEPCKVPNIGNGLRATRLIRENTSICGIMNGVLPPLQEDNPEPIAPSYTFDLNMRVLKRKHVFQLDGNTSTITDPVKNKEKLLAQCQGGLGKDTSLLQLINYSPVDTANVAFYPLTFKCQQVSFEVLGVYALRDIAAGEELRMDYGDVYFNLSSYYFFERFRVNLDDKILSRPQMWILFRIAEQHCSNDKGGIILLDEASQQKLIETLQGESQILLKIWQKEFFKTLEDLFKRKADYSQPIPAAEPMQTPALETVEVKLIKEVSQVLLTSQVEATEKFVQESTKTWEYPHFTEYPKITVYSELGSAQGSPFYPIFPKFSELPKNQEPESLPVVVPQGLAVEEAAQIQKKENSFPEDYLKNFEDPYEVKHQRSFEQQKNNFRTILKLKVLQDFNKVYKKIKSSQMSEDQIIDKIEDLNLKSLDSTIRLMVAFLFSDLEDQTKALILRHLLKYLKPKLEKTSEAKKMAKANRNFCFFKNASFLQLVAWMSKDKVFVSEIIHLHLKYCPESFTYKPDGNTAAEYANYYGNTLTETLLKRAETLLE